MSRFLLTNAMKDKEARQQRPQNINNDSCSLVSGLKFDGQCFDIFAVHV